MNTNPDPLRVLFLCTGNSARSQMAEAILRHLSRGKIDVGSAGTEPRQQIHPMARDAVARMIQRDMQGQFPKHLDRFIGQHFDYVITVCDRAAEQCPVLSGDPEQIHWAFEDPAAVEGAPEMQQRIFDRIADEIAARIRMWMSLRTVAERV